MQVYIQIKRTAETLNQCDRTGVRCGFCVANEPADCIAYAADAHY